MSVNSFSSYKDSLLHPNISSISSYLPLYIYCLISGTSSFIFITFILTNILLLPLFIFIIYHGFQQWRKNRSTSSATTMSHSDSFTYNMVTIEMIGVFGCILFCCGIYADHLITLLVGFYLFVFTWYGQMLFHVLTCVERYLAVVHPITYLSLRKERGIRIRNITIGYAWLLCFVQTSILMLTKSIFYDLGILIFYLSTVSYCSVSVLHVLIRPGPGEQGGGRERVDQSKQRAFYTITTILGVLVVKFTWNLVWAVLYMLKSDAGCVIMATGVWFNLPNSLVLPLLFLHRAEKTSVLKEKHPTSTRLRYASKM